MKNDLLERGYTYEHFHSLDDQMKNGSRSLLVCLGWLIYNKRFIENCFEYLLDENHFSNTKSSKTKSKRIFNENNEENIRLIEKRLEVNCRSKKIDLEKFRLNLFLFWLKNENLFWNWMVTNGE